MAESNVETILQKVLADLPTQFRAVLQADIEFHEWAEANQDDFAGFAQRYAAWVEAGEAYARSYKLVMRQFPAAADQMHGLLAPILREKLGA